MATGRLLPIHMQNTWIWNDSVSSVSRVPGAFCRGFGQKSSHNRRMIRSNYVALTAPCNLNKAYRRSAAFSTNGHRRMDSLRLIDTLLTMALQFPSIQEIIETYNDPQQMHAMSVHLPIAITILALVFLLLLAVKFRKSMGLRLAIQSLYLVGAAIAFFTAQAGISAHNQIQNAKIGLTKAAQDIMYTHEELGEYVWLALLIPGLVTGLLSIKKKGWFAPALVLSLIFATASLAYVGVVAHYGGRLVYEHGVGVPCGPNNIGIVELDEAPAVDEKREMLEGIDPVDQSTR